MVVIPETSSDYVDSTHMVGAGVDANSHGDRVVGRQIEIGERDVRDLYPVNDGPSAGHGLALECIIDEEISEMVVSDLDGDGVDEIVTIEPFHGHRLRVYKRGTTANGAESDHGWKSVWQCEDLSFAHGLNVVPVGGRNRIVVGNRRAGCELLAFDFQRSTGEFRRTVIDEGVGPTQIEPWFGTTTGRNDTGQVAIISCNQAAGEVAMYDLTTLAEA